MAVAAAPPVGPAEGIFHEVREGRILTVPNLLTAARAACIPLLFSLLFKPRCRGRLAAAFLLGALGVTDGLDGYIARRFDQVSALGKVADPLVDRALVICATAGAMAVRAVPRWLVAVVLGREVIVAGGGVALAIAGAPRVDVNHAGKAGTFGMMVALPLFIMASAPFRWRAGAKRLAWVAVTGGQLLGWAAVAGYAPKAVAVFGARSPRYSAGLDGGD